MEKSSQNLEESTLVLLTKKKEGMTVPQVLKGIVNAWKKSTPVEMKMANG